MQHPFSIKREPVESSAINAVGYDEASETLAVEFRNGLIYHYFSVKSDTYRQMMEDESLGQFFNQVVKGKHDSEQVYE